MSKLATEIALIPFPGLDVYHEPKPPSLPAAIVTILPVAAILEDNTALVLSVHPSVPPRDIVRIS